MAAAIAADVGDASTSCVTTLAEEMQTDAL